MGRARWRGNGFCPGGKGPPTLNAEHMWTVLILTSAGTAVFILRVQTEKWIKGSMFTDPP